MISNPIISKELVSVLRSRTALALALVSVGVLSLLALAMWPAAGVNPIGTLYSRLFLTVILCGQLAVLGLFTPPFSATAITYERESNTWETLYYTLLRPDQILVGKLVGAVAFLLLLVALSLPVSATCFILGGVSPKEIWLAYLVLIMSGITFGLVGLTSSALLGSSLRALIVTYLSLLVLCGGAHMPIVLLPEWRDAQPVLHAIRCLSPFTAVVAITRDAFRSIGPGASAAAVVRYFAYSGILCSAMILTLLARIAMRPGPKIAKRKAAVDDASLGIRVLRRFIFVLDPRRRRRSMPLWINPILLLDLRTRAAGLSNLIRACFACFIFAIGLVILVAGTYGATRPDVIRLIALSFQMGLILLLGPSLTIASIAGEVEGHTFDSLRMTPLHSWTIFFGKFAGAVMLSFMLVVSSVPVFFAILFIQEAIELRFLVPMLTVTGVTLFFCLATGLFFSSMCRTTARAGAWAYGLMALVTVVSLLGLVLQDRVSETMAKFILAFNPIVTVVGAVAVEQLVKFGRWQNNVWALGTISVVLFIATIYRLRHVAGPTA